MNRLARPISKTIREQRPLQISGFSSGTTQADILIIIHTPSKIKPTVTFRYEPLNEEQSSQFAKKISIDDFQKKYLADVDEKEMWKKFKADLWKEVEEGKINRIKYYRIVNKLTQKELAEKMNTSQPNIVRLEGMGYKPSIPTVKKLGKIFNVDFKDLIE